MIKFITERWFGILMLLLLCLIMVLLSACSDIEYLTYRERYGGYTVTCGHGYRPMETSPSSLATATPGYTYSKSIYCDQQPEAYGIYPVRHWISTRTWHSSSE